ncbi:hemicentin-1-like isoform X4 [Mytilus californianus]|uniref:hemicentin-1-like isoform X2 n=1 Tax=Mytilus californianus TaxID=6549 RepID=UPI002248548C|nr:hemicentin-1-like isoform X2 [Mytilus californianus]XP_052088607.1 hemicentin-1-like isoform X3 [Mytilus californianus]XP_052088609.1 hemicentin-1-like isoform X4 [Mytilus californianus]
MENGLSTRKCNNPTPQHGGKQCVGSSNRTESKPCRLKECPIDGEWSEYGNFNEWSACSVTCGNGSKTHERTRSCTKPEPQFGGKDCEGSEVDIQTESCDMLDCPVDGEWSEYGNFNEWSACSVTCGNGTKSHERTRSCTKPEPQFGGKDCEGSEVDIQTESCDMLDCPVDGEWSEYGNFNEWSACSVTCGNGTKSHERTRSCTKPEPQFGGKDCEGSEVDIQTESCDMLDCPEFECTSDGLFADPKDCTKFIQCANNIKYEMSCPLTTHWEQTKGYCVHGDDCN